MDMGAMFRAKQAWDTFTANHPKVPGFLNDVSQKGACEGMEIAIAVRYPDGTECKTGIRVKESDLELLNLMKSFRP